MADEFDDQTKTEPPSQRRRERAQEEGQFAHSPDLTTGVVLFAGVVALLPLASAVGNGLLAQTRLDLSLLPSADLSVENTQHLFAGKFAQTLSIAGALIGLLFVANLAVNLGQVGLNFNIARLSIDWDRVSPAHFDRLLSWNKIVRGLTLMLKIAAVAVVAWWILRQRMHEITHVSDSSLAAALADTWSLTIRLALGMAGTLLFIGVADYGYQRWRFEQTLYMSRQELKEEIKREEGDPQIKARVRKMQREAAQRKMFHKVPSATVIVTNPTHLAIALQYEAGMAAPKVVAKGAGHVAKRIVAIARQHGVPVLERKSLAQALFKTVKVDHSIPLGLYYIVAELMAYVYRLKGGVPTTAAK